MTTRPNEAARTRAAREGGRVDVLVTAVVASASALFAVLATHTWAHVTAAPWPFALFLGLTLVLQLTRVDIYGRGNSISVAGIGILATGFMFGAGAGMIAGFAAAALQGVRMRSKVHRASFNAGSWGLGAAAASGLYSVLATPDPQAGLAILDALPAGFVFWLLNIGLLTLVISLSEDEPYVGVWRERLAWATPHYLVSGVLAGACVVAYEKVGVAGLIAFTAPPGLVIFSMRQYVGRTRAAVDAVRRANEDLQRANDELEARNQDLRELFEFAGGLAAQAHDREALVGYAQASLGRMTGADVKIVVGLGEAGGETLSAGGHPLGSIHVTDTERWDRLRDALLPQLATALESAELVERIRKTHLETIAALSRSMEAKDYYTGGHTERVAGVAIALARRLGFQGADLDAIEIGALLHDIGKIGIPERILHKPGPLDDDEWKVMKEHPVISEYILSEVDLPPIVLQIARSSHERIDGTGYPDGLRGEEIPPAARIVLVADAFDALTSDRPYRRGRRVRDALEELREHTGTQLCPRVMAALEDVYREEPHVLAGGDHLHAVEVA